MSSEDLQAEQDVYRAKLLICRLRDLDPDESAAALRQEATLAGVSLRAAALAVLAPGAATTTDPARIPSTTATTVQCLHPRDGDGPPRHRVG